MGNSLKVLDSILELLADSQWHLLDEIQDWVSLDGTFKKMIAFLEENEFISLDKDKKRAQIKPKGLKFLELPVE